MTIREAVRRMIAAMQPWPGRRERKAAIRQARESAVAAREQAEHAQRQVRELKRIAYEDNGFASAIIEIAEHGWRRRREEDR